MQGEPLSVPLSDWARDFDVTAGPSSHLPQTERGSNPGPPEWYEEVEAAWSTRKNATAPWLHDFVAYSQLRDVASRQNADLTKEPSSYDATYSSTLPAANTLHAQDEHLFDRVFALAQGLPFFFINFLFLLLLSSVFPSHLVWEEK